jgi:hypothetical protein
VAEGADRLALEQQKARRKRRALVIVALVMLAPTVAMIAVNHVQTDVPPPLWKQADLGIFDEADNGWTPIRHYHSTTISGIDLEPLDRLMEAARSGSKLPDLGRLFQPARVVASKIREHTAICSEAFEHKRMVIPCLSLEPKACTAEPLEICTRLVTFAALDEASRGSPRGVELMSTVLRQLTDAAANSAHPWVQARVMLSLRQAIHHASAVIKWHGGDDKPLRASLQAINEDSLPLEHAVISSYLFKHLALRQALDKADTWLLDEGDILRGLNAPFEAARRGDPLPAPADHTKGLFWWFDNPIGKKMLDAVQPGADKDFLRTTELRATLLKRRDEALKLR